MKKKIVLGIMVLSTMMAGFESSAHTIGDQVNQQMKTLVDVSEELVVGSEPDELIIAYSEEEIELLALLTMAEAEGESEEGKRLVISTVLNRVDHENYPDTIHGVIYQKGQFTSMWNGRSKRCKVTEEVRQLVIEEMESRTNTDVIYFNSIGYPNYGKKLFKVGNHYFAAY